MDLRGMKPDRFLSRVRKGLESRGDRVLGNLAVKRGLIPTETLEQILSLPEVRTGNISFEKALMREGRISSLQMESLLEEQRHHELIDFLQTRTGSLPPEVEEAEFDEERNIGRYLLVKRIGQGGSAEVWKSWDRQMARWVAVKLLRTDILHPTTISRFQRESGLAGQLRHPNIVAVHDTGSWKDRLYIVMDLIEHGSLEQGPIKGQAHSAEIMEKVARAVHTAHEHGIIHRDLKPENLLIDERGEPLVTDFGLARSEREVEQLTETGSVLGTPLYMAPEQVLGNKIDARTDVYAMGIILYELLTGKRAFEGTTLGEIFRNITSGPTPSSPRTLNRGLSPDLEKICMRALAREPADRYRSAEEFAEDLSRFRRGMIPLARPVSFPVKALRWGKRNPLPTTLGMGMILISLVGLALFFQSRSEHETRVSALRRAQKAAQAYAAGNYAAAGREAEEAIRIDPDSSEGHFWSGRVLFHDYLRRRHLPTVAIFVDEIRFIPPPGESPKEKSLLAKAGNAFGKISPDGFEGTNTWQWNASQGMLALVREDYPEAEKQLRLAREETPDREITYLHSLSLYFQKRFLEAKDILDEISPPREIIMEVARIKVAHALAIEAEKAGKPAGGLHDQALDLCQKFTYLIDRQTLAALEAHIRTTREVHLHTEGKLTHPDEQLDAVLDLLEKLPGKTIDSEIILAKAAMARGQFAYIRGDLNEAGKIFTRGIEALNRMEEISPSHLLLPLMRANLLTLRASLRYDPQDPSFVKSEVEEALHHLQRLDSPLTDTPHVIMLQAMLAALARPRPEAYEDAIRHLDRAIEQNPEKAALLVARAGWLIKLAEGKIFAGENPRPVFRRAHRDILKALELPPLTYLLFDAEKALATNIFLAGNIPQMAIENQLKTLVRILDNLSNREPDSPRIVQFQALIHFLKTILLKRSGSNAGPDYEKGLALLETIHPQNRTNSGYLTLLSEAWLQYGMYRHARGKNPVPQVEKALTIARERERIPPHEFSIALRVRELLLTRSLLTQSGSVIDWKELEKALEGLSRFVDKNPDNSLARIKRANFAYQLAALKNRRGLAMGNLVDLVVQDTNACIDLPRLARKALMLRALIRGMAAVESVQRSVRREARKNIRIAVNLLDLCGKDFEIILKTAPDYVQANLYRAEIFFNALVQNTEGFLREGGTANPERLIQIIHRDLTLVLAPSDNAQAFLLRAQVRLLELFLAGDKPPDEDTRSLVKNCLADATKGGEFRPAMGRYITLAARFFEYKFFPPERPLEAHATLQKELTEFLRENPQLKSAQSNQIMREIASILEQEE